MPAGRRRVVAPCTEAAATGERGESYAHVTHLAVERLGAKTVTHLEASVFHGSVRICQLAGVVPMRERECCIRLLNKNVENNSFLGYINTI